MLTRGIHIGNLFGIRIQLDFSLIFIFGLVLFNLGAGVFPSWHPDWSAPLVWTVAASAALLFFVSILIHELSHALVAKAYGIPVRSITLFLFGGLANIADDPDSPKKEALMAGIGPVTSIALGVAFTALAGMLVDLPPEARADPVLAFRHMGPVSTLLAWLGPINVLVGVFNMLPGFPLDGGRVLRALLWAVTRDLRRATRWASRTGQAFAFLFVTAGIAMAFGLHVPFLGSGLIGGLWLAFIGWFLNTAAVMAYRQLLMRDTLRDVPVARLMHRQLPRAISPGDTVTRLVDDYVMPTGEQLFPVTDAGALLGFVRTKDIRKVRREDWPQTPVRSLMIPLADFPKTSPNESAYDAVRRLADEADELVVTADTAVFGVLDRQDVDRWLSLQAEPPTPRGTGPRGFAAGLRSRRERHG